MRTFHNLKFYGVGQGLFAHGAVGENRRMGKGNLNYIYDCGGGLKDRRERYIDEAVSALDGKSLDILFLSHLHNDHISGLDYLLKKLNGSVKMVVLPYLYPAERVALHGFGMDADDDPEGFDDWYVNFLKAPGSYLREMGVQNVYFIRGGDGPGSENPQEGDNWPPEWMGGDDRDQEQNIDRVGQVTAMEAYQTPEHIANACREAEELTDSGESADSLKNILTSRSGIRAGRWFFLLFNMEVEQSLLKTFQEEFEKIRNESSLIDVLRNKDKLKLVKNAYLKLVGSEDEFNNSSLAVLCTFQIHRAQSRFVEWYTDTKTSIRCADSCCGHQRHHCSSHNFFHPHRHPQDIYDRDPGFVFTGDLQVNKVWESLSSKFSLEKGILTITYQVPHHGSHHNWHATQANIAEPIYVVSAGIENKLSHPGASVLWDIAKANRQLAWVHENSSFTQETMIRGHP